MWRGVGSACIMRRITGSGMKIGGRDVEKRSAIGNLRWLSASRIAWRRRSLGRFVAAPA
jgi:hypothetical protein